MLCQAVEQRPVVCLVRSRLIQDHDVQTGKLLAVLPEGFPDNAFQSVSRHGKPAVFLGDGEPEPRDVSVIIRCQDRKHVVATAAGLFEHAIKRRGIRQAADSVKPVIGRITRAYVRFAFAVCRRFFGSVYWRVSGVGCKAYGVSCARPLARRRFNTRRPALVAILARNPCVRARFKMLGWNVRFMGLVPGFDGGYHPRLKEGRQGYAGVQLVSIEQAVNSGISRLKPFSGGTGVDVLDCLPAVDFGSDQALPIKTSRL